MNLGNCRGIDDDGITVLSRLTNLTSLDLSDCNITDSGLAHLQNLTNLTSLDLTGCYTITDSGLAHLQNLTNLTSLDLSWCSKITDSGVLPLIGENGLPNLRSLNVDDYHLSQQLRERISNEFIGN